MPRVSTQHNERARYNGGVLTESDNSLLISPSVVIIAAIALIIRTITPLFESHDAAIAVTIILRVYRRLNIMDLITG